MEADWEVEIGAGAPVIEADWSGFVDLSAAPERIVEIEEAAAFPPLAALLLALNAPTSPVWTSKCDRWQPEPQPALDIHAQTPRSEPGAQTTHPGADTLAIYIDLLPRTASTVFSDWQQAEAFCRQYVARLQSIAPPDSAPQHSIDLVIRQAVAGRSNGFGITAYLSVAASRRPEAALAAVVAAFGDALPPAIPSV